MNIYQPLLHEGSVVRLIWLAINFELATTLGVHRCCQELELQAHRSILWVVQPLAKAVCRGA